MTFAGDAERLRATFHRGDCIRRRNGWAVFESDQRRSHTQGLTRETYPGTVERYFGSGGVNHYGQGSGLTDRA